MDITQRKEWFICPQGIYCYPFFVFSYFRVFVINFLYFFRVLVMKLLYLFRVFVLSCSRDNFFVFISRFSDEAFKI